ncbi:hypothetical protein ZIOFF_067536 [Zingiber officinale]|uniref:Uncharacterized protein n=2 Tax=Zingiber officinale TaxID=94328 RepID=A0A8J5CDY9_ZINOF|nr:hypothetical protein ZIOFF_067536 [Zingiber officinale]
MRHVSGHVWAQLTQQQFVAARRSPAASVASLLNRSQRRRRCLQKPGVAPSPAQQQPSQKPAAARRCSPSPAAARNSPLSPVAALFLPSALFLVKCFETASWTSSRVSVLCNVHILFQTLTLVPDHDHGRLLSRAISRIPPLDRFPVEMASRLALLAFALASLAVSASAQGPAASPSKSPSVAPVKPPAPSPLLPPPTVAPVRPPAAAPLSAPPAPVPAAKSPSLSPPAPPTSDIPAPAPRSSISGVPASAPTAPPPAGNGAADLSFSWIGAFAVAAVAFAM